MLDEICPIQFIEGINECGEYVQKSVIGMQSYPVMAIEYIPKSSYSLTKLEICLFLPPRVPEEKTIRVALYSDYNGNPSDIVLTEGTFVPNFSKEKHQFIWQEIQLSPVVVSPNNKYWVTVYPQPLSIALVDADEGVDSTLRVKKNNNKWDTLPNHIKESKVMLRFYGRVLPMAS